LSIADLAYLVAKVVRPATPVRIAEASVAGMPPARYVPSTARAERELNVHGRVMLEEAVLRTAHWYQ
jgi:nucleoside-diphosphate-sugar epimerase